MLYISYLGVTPPPVCYKRARGGRSQRIFCAESQGGGAHVDASSQEEPRPPSESQHQSAPVKLPDSLSQLGPRVQSPPVSEARRARGGLVRERRRRAGPWWGN